MGEMTGRIQTITVAQSAEFSSSFTLESYEIFVGVEFPAMDNGDIGIQYTRNGGASWSNILDPSDGDTLLVVKSGSEPGIIDISDFIRFAHANKHHQMRFTCAAQTSVAVNIIVLTRG